MGEFDRLKDLENKINETIDRELDQLEDVFLGLFEEEEETPEVPKKRGRPKGVQESKPRKAKSNSLELIIERTLKSLERLEHIL